MQSWSSKDFTADRAWGALDIANFSGTTVRLHWTDLFSLVFRKGIFASQEVNCSLHYCENTLVYCLP